MYNRNIMKLLVRRIICANNVDLLSQIVTNNEIKDSLILERIITHKERESKQLGEKFSLI